MRRETLPTVDGGNVEVLVPENEEDVEVLRRRRDLDDRLSFGDREGSTEARRKMKAAVIALMLVASPSFAEWTKGCSGSDCRVFTTTTIRAADHKDTPATLVLEVRADRSVLLTVTTTRANHERFYSTRPETYVRRGGQEYVPATSFFSAGGPTASPSSLVVDEGPAHTFAPINESQARGDGGGLIEEFIAGTRAVATVQPRFDRAVSAEFSLAGFTAAWKQVEKREVPPSQTGLRMDPLDAVATAIPTPNGPRVSRADLRAKENPNGEGTFVCVRKQRPMAWFVGRDGSVYNINGAAHSLTPQLGFPRDAPVDYWQGTGLDRFAATTEGLRVCFGM